MQTQEKAASAPEECFPLPELDPNFELGDDLAWGEWLYRWLESCFDVEIEPWAVDLVGRAAERLNRERTPAEPLMPVVLWISSLTAFTGPGRYLYVSRGLLHRACWEEAIAFTLAHEMAHHDLGHTRIFRGKLELVRHLPGVFGAAFALTMADRWLHGPENETAADSRALDLCLAAGYDGSRCLELFDIFEAYALDHGAVESVFGPNVELNAVEGGFDRWRAAAQSWLWRRRYGYPSIRSRKELLIARLNAKQDVG
jgi:predicted Zn-dependent protease